MSQIIAPGKWDPDTRKKTKRWGVAAGVALIVCGMGLALVLARMFLMTTREPSMWLAIIVLAPPLVPTLIGFVMAMPDVGTALLYRVLDKVGKKSP